MYVYAYIRIYEDGGVAQPDLTHSVGAWLGTARPHPQHWAPARPLPQSEAEVYQGAGLGKDGGPDSV